MANEGIDITPGSGSVKVAADSQLFGGGFQRVQKVGEMRWDPSAAEWVPSAAKCPPTTVLPFAERTGYAQSSLVRSLDARSLVVRAVFVPPAGAHNHNRDFYVRVYNSTDYATQIAGLTHNPTQDGNQAVIAVGPGVTQPPDHMHGVARACPVPAYFYVYASPVVQDAVAWQARFQYELL